MAMFTVQVQLQLLAIAAGHITAHAHGQRFTAGSIDVAIGVAAQALADIGSHAQGALTGFGQVQVLRTNAQGDRAAQAQRRAAQG